jgi:hypothetical protein
MTVWYFESSTARVSYYDADKEKSQLTGPLHTLGLN